MGFGDWEANTKHNTNFNFPGGWLTITLANGKTYENPIKWYFYKDNIIGIGKEHLQGNQEPVFFVINEIVIYKTPVTKSQHLFTSCKTMF